VTLWKFAPETLWLLPGLWQVLTSLGPLAARARASSVPACAIGEIKLMR
jgi:hypothetical protein